MEGIGEQENLDEATDMAYSGSDVFRYRRRLVVVLYLEWWLEAEVEIRRFTYKTTGYIQAHVIGGSDSDQSD